MPIASRLFGAIAVGVALLSATATFLVLAGMTPIDPVQSVVVTLLAVNAVTGILLLAIIGLEVWVVIQARRRGHAGSRLHVQIVSLFAVIAAVPTVLVAVVASTTLDRGLDRYFSSSTRAIIKASDFVANAYVGERLQAMHGEVLAMAYELARAKPLFDQDRDKFHNFLTQQAAGRGLSAVLIFTPDGQVVDRADIPIAKQPVLPKAEALSKVTETDAQIGPTPEGIDGTIKLYGYDNMYLYVVGLLDPQVIQQLTATRQSVAQYADLELHKVGIQVAFALMFGIIALIVLLSSAWIGLDFANRLVAPIRRLIGAANVVSTGNLQVQVPIQGSGGDLARLGETFNKMTHELRTQHEDIVRARDLIDSRRRFTEAVLAGASAGVIGVNADGKVTILNRSAERLTGRTESEALGRPLTEIAPELAEIFQTARYGNQRLVQRQVTVARDGQERNFSVRVTSEQAPDAEHGYVITIDDITELVAGAAHLGLGRHRPPHRPRDQKSAHPDPIVGGAAAPQIQQGDCRRRCGVRAMHRHHRAPGRRHQTHGRRILALCPHAEAGHDRRGRCRYRASGGLPAPRRPSRHRLRGRIARRRYSGPFRSAADLAGAHQHRQERHRSDRRGAAGSARPRQDHRQRAARG